ncbi:MAG TPA: hypothetical protein VJ020_05525 [Anaerolineales bacterium]|nr:hypothetical protein [Anaerolineales bacterium]
MDDWQKMSLYTDSRLEDIRRQAQVGTILERTFSPVGKTILISTALLLGMLIWWIA